MYKKLNLNRDRIRDTIIKYLNTFTEGTFTVSDFEEKGKIRRRIFIKEEYEGEFFIDFHFLNNGTSSIDLSSGGKSELKKQIADFIISDPKCVIGNIHEENKCFIADNITIEDFTVINDMLRESEFCASVEVQQDEAHKIYKIIGKHNDRITVNYYSSNGKIMIQGRPLLLFNEAIIIITELIDLDKLPKLFSNNFEISVSKQNIDHYFQHFFPYSYDKLALNLKKILHQAVYNLQLEGDMYDYTYLAFPAFKGLEGHLKITLHEKGVHLEKNRFNMYKPDEKWGKYKLKECARQKINNQILVDYFERAYNFYNRQRHSLFHYADPILPWDETRIIENIGEVKGLIKDSFTLIDEYFQFENQK